MRMTFSCADNPVKLPLNKLRGKSVTIYGAIGTQISEAVFMLGSSTNQTETAEFFRRIRMAQPWDKRERLVIVLDNHPAHKTSTIKTLAKNLNFELLYLPPYKPEMNPIESLWSVIKHDLKIMLLQRRYETLTQANFRQLLKQCLSKVTPAQQSRAARTNHRGYMLKILNDM